MIPRGYCENCGHFHNELPDFLSPYKHYSARVIEDVVDDVSTPEDSTTEESPCERTMQRWKDWISGNKNQIDGFLRSIGQTLPGFSTELLKSTDSLLEKLREYGSGWLSIINRVIYNTGNRLSPGCHNNSHLLCLSGQMLDALSSSYKEVALWLQKKYRHGRMKKPLKDSS